MGWIYLDILSPRLPSWLGWCKQRSITLPCSQSANCGMNLSPCFSLYFFYFSCETFIQCSINSISQENWGGIMSILGNKGRVRWNNFGEGCKEPRKQKLTNTMHTSKLIHTCHPCVLQCIHVQDSEQMSHWLQSEVFHRLSKPDLELSTPSWREKDRERHGREVISIKLHFYKRNYVIFSCN